TTATPISVLRCSSRWPVSATAVPGKRRCTSAISGRTADRFCFSERTSPSSTSRVSAPTYTSGPMSSGARLLPHLVGLDDITDLDVVVADADTAFEALAHLGRVVLEPAQRFDREVLRDDYAVPDQPGLAVTGDGARPHDAAGHVADPRHPEDLPDLGRAELGLLEDGLEHALQSGFDFLDRLVDDRVVADVHALALRQLARPARSPAPSADSRSSRVILGRRWANMALRSLASRRSAICLATRSSSTTRKLSPAPGTAVRPSTCTGRDGGASPTWSAFSSKSARTRPKASPATMESPTCRVPRCTSTVATGPRPRSRWASIATPWPGCSGLA